MELREAGPNLFSPDRFPGRRALLLFFLISIFASAFAMGKSGPGSREAEAAAQAQAAFDRGAFEEAAAAWSRTADLQRRAGETPALIDSLTSLGTAYQAMGRHHLALLALEEAARLARGMADIAREADALNGSGVANTFSHGAEHAEGQFQEALKLAHKAGDRGREASILNNLGILSAQNKPAAACDAYEKSISLAEDAGDLALAAKARANLAEAAARNGEFDRAAKQNRAAIAAASNLADSHDKTFCLSHCGKNWELIFKLAPEHEQSLRLQALHAYEKAAVAAQGAGDLRALSFALGYTGHLYEEDKKYPEAMALTRRAAFLLQQIQKPASLYLWEWQTGRIDRAEGRQDEAIADYRRAIYDLDQVRNDLSARLGNANAHSSFREAAGDVFFEMADLLLQRADKAHNEKDLAATLKEARDTCETLRSVELEDYFQDDCVNLLKAKIKPIEDLAKGAAVIYIIPLKDRTEIIVSTKGKLERVKTPVTSEELTATVRAFRIHLETRTTGEYLEEARQLYAWLIRPLEPLLAKNGVDTLVFIPDGALRTIPMAALQDGDKFLIEKYAIAITPGLTLMEPTPTKRMKVLLMANGLTEARQYQGQDFPALPNVKTEIDGLQKIFGGKTLMNAAFENDNLKKVFDAQPFSIVHIASHGEFNGDISKTFVLTYDKALKMDDLERLLRPAQLRDQPVELLCLSACETAAGDDRAALGLAGVAVKAGARSAFATLWCVNDEASATLISDFYSQLQRDPNISKAKALQKAQVRLLTQPRTSHPCLWAPYLIIGNWL